MLDTVECPYCNHENDMSEGTVDLPSDNRFDHECTNTECGREFEVFVEFTPSYSSGKINDIECEKCAMKTRDIRTRGRTFPYPESLEEDNVCGNCYILGYRADLDKEKLSAKTSN